MRAMSAGEMLSTSASCVLGGAGFDYSLKCKSHASGHDHMPAHSTHTNMLLLTCSVGNSRMRSLGSRALGDSICIVASAQVRQWEQVALKADRLLLLPCRELTICMQEREGERNMQCGTYTHSRI